VTPNTYEEPLPVYAVGIRVKMGRDRGLRRVCAKTWDRIPKASAWVERLSDGNGSDESRNDGVDQDF
jgi:hypothetical protein